MGVLRVQEPNFKKEPLLAGLSVSVGGIWRAESLGSLLVEGPGFTQSSYKALQALNPKPLNPKPIKLLDCVVQNLLVKGYSLGSS